MSSVDDRLREAFGTADDEWVRRAPAAHRELRSRRRRNQLLQRGVVGALTAAAVAVVLVMVDGDVGTRTVQPAAPVPTTSSAPPVGSTPLEGTWVSAPLRAADVRAAARAAGDRAAAAAMLDDLPVGDFKVVLVVRGSSLRALVRSDGTADQLLDEEVISTTGQELELRTLFGQPRTSVHGWRIRGAELTMTFRSTTEGPRRGVPGQAWQRLLYDTAEFTR